jgi:cytochrome P450
LDFVEHRVFGKTIFFLYSAEPCEELLLGKTLPAERDTQHRIVQEIFGNGLASSVGDEWTRQRKMIAPAMAAQHGPRFAAAVGRQIESLSERWRNQPRGKPRDILSDMRELCLASGAEALFSLPPGQGLYDVTALGSDIIANGFHLRDFLPRLRKGPRPMSNAAMQRQQAAQRLIAQRRASGGDPDDVFSAFEHSLATDPAMTEQNMLDQFYTLLGGSLENPSIALAWAWFEIGRRPDVQRAILDEVNGVLGERAATADDLPKLIFTRQVINETLRLYPPLPLMVRWSPREYRFEGLTIPEGAGVWVWPYVLHRHRKLWDRPEEFIPERFATGAGPRFPKGAYMPFGHGPRGCVAFHLCMTLMVISVATLVQRFRVRLTPGTEVRKMVKINLRPDGGVPLLIEPRRAA